MIAVIFPRPMLPLRQDELSALAGVRIPGRRGAGALVSSIAHRLPGRLDEVSALDAPLLGTAAMDVLTVALASRLDRRRRCPTAPGSAPCCCASRRSSRNTSPTPR